MKTPLRTQRQVSSICLEEETIQTNYGSKYLTLIVAYFKKKKKKDVIVDVCAAA